jgi:hypothetical protein
VQSLARHDGLRREFDDDAMHPASAEFDLYDGTARDGESGRNPVVERCGRRDRQRDLGDRHARRTGEAATMVAPRPDL